MLKIDIALFPIKLMVKSRQQAHQLQQQSKVEASNKQAC